VLAESFERIHRSNLVGMGVLPLQFKAGESADSLGLTGEETYSVSGLGPAKLNDGVVPEEVAVRADGTQFTARPRIDTPMEAAYYRRSTSSCWPSGATARPRPRLWVKWPTT
jgi:aconitate hydratase